MRGAGGGCGVGMRRRVRDSSGRDALVACGNATAVAMLAEWQGDGGGAVGGEHK